MGEKLLRDILFYLKDGRDKKAINKAIETYSISLKDKIKDLFNDDDNNMENL
jgi:hypothetical protein